jgi:hypothetical protein
LNLFFSSGAFASQFEMLFFKKSGALENQINSVLFENKKGEGISNDSIPNFSTSAIKHLER